MWSFAVLTGVVKEGGEANKIIQDPAESSPILQGEDCSPLPSRTAVLELEDCCPLAGRTVAMQWTQ
jgi:hypothetical protein